MLTMFATKPMLSNADKTTMNNKKGKGGAKKLNTYLASKSQNMKLESKSLFFFFLLTKNEHGSHESPFASSPLVEGPLFFFCIMVSLYDKNLKIITIHT